jgi:hypothetical protein
MLPAGPVKFEPGSAGQMERETLWRDEHGLHFAWNPGIIEGGDGLRLVLTTIDPATEEVSHRFFPKFFMGGVARSPSGVLCLGGQLVEGSTVTTGALLIDQNDPNVEIFLPIYSSDQRAVHVGWDGEAFAVHFWGSTALEVARVSEAGQLIMQPAVFGAAAGALPDLRLSTDSVSGVSFAVSGEFVKVPWIAAHTREGKPVPGTEATGGKILPVQGELGSANSVAFTTVRGVPGGALVGWGTVGNPDAMVVMQRIDAALAPVGDAVLVKPTKQQGTDEEKDWLTIQEEGNGWWVGAGGPIFLESVRWSPAGVTVENLSSYELARSGQMILDFRHLGSARYGDELWLGFVDETANFSTGKLYQPYRIVRILPGCKYPSLWDLLHEK